MGKRVFYPHAGVSSLQVVWSQVMTTALEPPDLERCQTNRPNTWPEMPSFMNFGPVTYKRCTNPPTWLADDGVGQMSLCDECKQVCEKLVSFRRKGITITYTQLSELIDSTGGA